MTARARIAIADYGIGNLRSVERALIQTGADARLTTDPATVRAADGVVVPGVGAFGACINALTAAGLRDPVLAAAAEGRPVLGICVGFQMLFDHSDEFGGHSGLGILRGRVARIAASRGKVPHMGWNALRHHRPSRLLEGLEDGTHVYFVHSYAAVDVPAVDIIAEVDYSGPIVAAVERGVVMGTQFHPEKSGRDGLRIYANFAAVCAGVAGATGPV